MFPKFKLFTWKDLPLREYLYLSIAILVFLSAILLILKNFIPPIVPLFYGGPVGESQLIESIWLFISPGISLAVILLNSLIAGMTSNVFLKKILILSAFLFTLLISITTLKIIFLVGYF